MAAEDLEGAAVDLEVAMLDLEVAVLYVEVTLVVSAVDVEVAEDFRSYPYAKCIADCSLHVLRWSRSLVLVLRHCLIYFVLEHKYHYEVSFIYI